MGARGRFVDLNRGPFNRAEAAFYEVLSARAVHAIVSPVLVGAVQGAPRGLVLDVGCGSGDITEDLQDEDRDAVGADPSMAQLHRLRRRRATACVAAPAGWLPFATGRFSAVIASCSIKHWPSLSQGLSECVRVLAPGGLLAIVEIDGGTDADDLVRFAARARVPPGLRRGYRAMARHSFVRLTPNPADLAGFLSGAGLRQVSQERIPELPFFVVTAWKARVAAT